MPLALGPPGPIATTDGEGRFRALVPRWARCIVAYVGETPVFAEGPWQEDATVELRAPK
jgi:hypothetical protein